MITRRCFVLQLLSDIASYAIGTADSREFKILCVLCGKKTRYSNLTSFSDKDYLELLKFFGVSDFIRIDEIRSSYKFGKCINNNAKKCRTNVFIYVELQEVCNSAEQRRSLLNPVHDAIFEFAAHDWTTTEEQLEDDVMFNSEEMRTESENVILHQQTPFPELNCLLFTYDLSIYILHT